MSQATTISTTAVDATHQRLLATPLGRQFGHDILQLEALFPGAQLSAMAEALEDENHYIYTALRLGGCFLPNGEIRDVMVMPRDGPEAAKIKLRPIPTTNCAIRQYQLENIGSHPEEDRQAFLFDFYDTARNFSSRKFQVDTPSQR